MQAEIARLSQQPRSPSPNHAKSGVSKLNGSSRSRPSKDIDASSAAFTDRAAKVRPRSNDSPTVKRKAAHRSAGSFDPVPDLSTYSWQSNAPDSRQPPSHSNSAKVREPHAGSKPAASNSLSAPSRSISSSRSAKTLTLPVDAVSGRPRSKSNASSSKASKPRSPSATQSFANHPPTDTADQVSSSAPNTKPLASAPSKLSLRSRIFGLKSPKVASPTASSFDSGTEASSPRSSRFTPSIHSEASQSETSLLEPSPSSPSYPGSSVPQGRNNEDEMGGNASDVNSRKSSGASSLLRKTIRFRDKSAFLKARPSVSSATSDSAASGSTSVPPSPLDPPGTSDAESSARKSLSYKQISGRRGAQYSENDQIDTATPGSVRHRRSGPPADADRAHDALALLPAVTERDLEASPKLQRSSSQRPSAKGQRHERRGSNSSRYDASGSPSLTSSYQESETGSRIPRSSSPSRSIGRSKSIVTPSSHAASDRSSPSSSRADPPKSPGQRPLSGSSFAPHIQPRTTSSPMRSTGRRPTTAQDSPSPAASPAAVESSAKRATQRTVRPKTAETGHAYSTSLSSLRDILMASHAISEEGAIYNTPEKAQAARFESSASPSLAADASTSPSDSRRPGLPPKNPLRKQRPSNASVTNTPSISGDSPASVHTSGIFSGPSMIKPADERLVVPTSGAHEAVGLVSSSKSKPSIIDFRTPTSGSAQASPMERQPSDDYFRSRDLNRSSDAPSRPTSARSPGWTHAGGTPSPAHSPYARPQQLSRAPSSDRYPSSLASRHERSTSDASLSLTDLRSSIGPGASTPSLHSESSSGTKKKREGAGSKMMAFARDLTHRDGSNDPSPTLASSGTFRLGKSSKSKKADATPRPVIRRLYDGPLEGEAAASAADNTAGDVSNAPLSYTNGVSPGSSVIELHAAAGPSPRTPNFPSNRDSNRRPMSSGSVSRSVPSSGGTARDLMTPPSGHLVTPQFGLNGHGPFAPRSPSFAPPSWSIPQDDLTAEQKRLVKRWFVLRELLETERAYASDLAVARDIYLARAKMQAGITAPLSPLSVRSASIFSQLASPGEPPVQSQSSGSQPQQRGSVSVTGSGTPLGRGALPQRTLFRHASADATANVAPASPSSANQTASSASLTSSNPSNRSSMYTVSSQSSQTSEASQLNLLGHPALVAGLPSRFSIEGNTLSPLLAHKLTPGTPATGASSIASPYSSTSGTPSVSTTSGILSPSFAGSAEGLAVASSDAPFSASDVRIIFAQLEACAAFADEMVVLLEDAVGKICNGSAEDAVQLLAQNKVREEAETDRVGQVFLRMMPRIEQVYSAYCSRHEASMAKLQELLNTQPKVGAFLSECTRAARAYTNAWDLSSLLIKPVQRVLKYPLLLSQIAASTSSQHPDSESLTAASIEIQKVADNINEVKKRKDLVEQIVSGKTTKRTTSQRMQHGATKKLLRRQEKVKKLVLGPAEDILADEGQYKALVGQFRQLEKSTGAFAKRCTGWSSSVKDAHVAHLRLLEQWTRAYAVGEVATSTEAEHRLRAFAQLVEGTLLNEYWTQLDSEIRTSLKPGIQRISAMFTLPQAVIAKRDDREPDYTRYRADITRGGAKAVDKKLTESANAFVALHTQLMNELPQFNYGVQTLLDLCIESLARTQASYHLRVHQALLQFWQTHGPEGNTDIVSNEETAEKSMRHVNPVKLFWPLHRNMAGFAESLGIVQGTVADRRSRSTSMSVDSELLAVAGSLSPASTTHFSPLQSTRTLPDPDFASRVPDATSMSQQIESITAAGSEELLEPISEGASPGSFATPPLGSQQHRASLSPQPRHGSLLGSPAPIGAVPLPDAQEQQQQRPSLRTTKSGGLLGLLRSVGGSQATGSRKASQSFDTANESFGDAGLGSSEPPTPVSKDSPEQRDVSLGEAVTAPVLPALTFNSGLFGQSDAVFTETGGGRKARTLSATSAMETMAAVANSPMREKAVIKNGYAFIDYAVGDLFRVLDADHRYLFGSSEHGTTGWVERENFVPLS